MLQIRGEVHAMRGDACLPHKIMQELPVSAAEGFIRCARRETQFADGFLLID